MQTFKVEFGIIGEDADISDLPLLYGPLYKGMILEKWTREDGVIHRDGGPAIQIHKDEPGNDPIALVWLKEGVIHADIGAAIEELEPEWHHKHWRCYKDGLLHNPRGAAFVTDAITGEIIDRKYFLDGVEYPDGLPPRTGPTAGPWPPLHMRPFTGLEPS